MDGWIYYGRSLFIKYMIKNNMNEEAPRILFVCGAIDKSME